MTVPQSHAKTVRDAMHHGCECIGERQSVRDAAMLMEKMDIGVLPICGEDDRLKGMLTDRDIVVRVIARGMDPATTTAGELGQGRPVVVRAEAPVEEALSLMREHAIKRLPVLDESKRLCGIVTEADIAMNLPGKKTGEVVEAIAAAPPQHF